MQFKGREILQNIFKSNVTRMLVALSLVGILSGAILVFVYNYAIPKIKVNMTQETDRAIKSIFPDTDKVEKTKTDGVSKIVNSKGKLLGYAFDA